MSNYKQNCTKVPATYKKREVGIFCDVYSTDPGEGGFPSIARTEDEANAELIAEAFSVLAETGMTPRELAEEMYKAVREQARQQDRAEIAALKAEVERLRKATAEVLEGEDLGLITWDCQCEEEIGITCGCCQAFEQLSAALDKKHRPCP